MISETLPKKIWKITYPILTHIVIYILVLFGADILFSTLNIKDVNGVSPLEAYAGIITSVALVITIPILYTYLKRDYPVNEKKFLKSPKAVIAVIILGIAAAHGLSLLISLFAEGSAAAGYQNIENAIFAGSPYIVLLRTIILAPLCEEVLFRGLVFRRLKEYTNFWAASLISSLIFAVYHLNLLQGIYAFIFGLILCLVYEKMRNLWASIFLHAAGNAIAIILSYSGFSYPSTAVYIIIMILLILISAGICYMIIKDKIKV